MFNLMPLFRLPQQHKWHIHTISWHSFCSSTTSLIPVKSEQVYTGVSWDVNFNSSAIYTHHFAETPYEFNAVHVSVFFRISPRKIIEAWNYLSQYYKLHLVSCLRAVSTIILKIIIIHTLWLRCSSVSI